jgi:hypothetical protein
VVAAGGLPVEIGEKHAVARLLDLKRECAAEG